MKKGVAVLSIISSIVTSIIIICTFLTSYHFWNLGYIFNSYRPIQISVSITLILLGIRLYINGSGRRRYVYALISIFLAIGIIILMPKAI